MKTIMLLPNMGGASFFTGGAEGVSGVEEGVLEAD